ncbi:hypothetical protein [Nocardioides donggukensis]|uniref:DUF4232 domain-containing protein n=1 Tax=Nocardioides donggukensis TaxID=2774019 RepID=A0A927Q2Z1_9ACTN|nr:hypothetical protein [Nocardioides donggukensis]MBD8870854.1 hypothetical protein [Nocardioides donggukensis]
MSAVTRPRGPLPPRVYWTRRVLVLVVAFGLVFGLGRVLGNGSDAESGSGATAAQVGGQPTSEPSADDTATKKSKKKKKKRKPAQPSGPCASSDVVVTPALEQAVADDEIRIRFDVSGSEPACTWTASRSSLVVKITSGRDEIWSSQQCPGVLPAKDLVVRKKQPARYAFTWNGKRSDEDCSRFTDWAVPGYYHVVAASLGGEPTDTQFRLRRQPQTTVTRTAEPEPQDKKTKRADGETRPTEETPDGQRDGAQEPDG